MIAVPVPPVSKIAATITDPAALRVFGTLRASFPNSIRGVELMGRAGFDSSRNPVTSFVSLCIAFRSLNQALIGTGWQAERSGGTPGHHYRLRPVHPSRGGNA